MSVTSAIRTFGTKVVANVSKNSPTILAGLAIAGVVATAVVAVKATLKSKEVIEDHEEQLDILEEKFEDDPSIEDATKREMIRQVYINTAKRLLPIYAPVAITGIMAIACIFGCNSVHTRRQAALAAAYNISESTLRNYEAKARELVGSKKAEQIKDEANVEKIKSIVNGSPAVIETGKGSELFIDNQTGQLFRSNMEYVRHCVTDIDNRLTDMGGDTFIPLNDLLMAWGCHACELGRDLGFNVETRMQKHLTLFDELHFTHWTDPDTTQTYHFIEYPIELEYSVRVK